MKTNQIRRMANTALSKLAGELEAGMSDQLQVYLSAMAKLHRYSFGNVMLIGGNAT
ncbi:MAG: hypothetical protein QF749_13480 [Verrucomicrobiota bacterium]|nr:hypothetical protein [Verrucomicrobiota bacterium]